jgi:hypothetical protein
LASVISPIDGPAIVDLANHRLRHSSMLKTPDAYRVAADGPGFLPSHKIAAVWQGRRLIGIESTASAKRNSGIRKCAGAKDYPPNFRV